MFENAAFEELIYRQTITKNIQDIRKKNHTTVIPKSQRKWNG